MKMVISITGAGGKTTLMFKLAEELRIDCKVLVTTTTKIYLPGKNQYDYIAYDSNEINQLNQSSNKGIYVYGNFLNEENKLIGLEPEFLDQCAGYFDHVIIESDGAKRKLIKGWNSWEPVISGCTTHTLGVLNANALGMEINHINVHRPEEFIKITGTHFGDKINVEHLTNMVFNENGLFKNSKGKRILYMIGDCRKLIGSIKERNTGYIDEIRSSI